MDSTILVVLSAFVLGAAMPLLITRIKKRPKGYVRIGHNGEIDIERRARRSYSPRGDEPKPIRSKFDSLFDSDKKKDKPKVDLESVERSFTPDPKPAVTLGANELRNNYVDFSHLAADTPGYPERSSDMSGSGFSGNPNPYSSMSSGFGQNPTTPSSPYGSSNSMGMQNYGNNNENNQFSSSGFSPSPAPSSFPNPMSQQPAQTPFSQAPKETETSDDDDDEKEEKEHEWKPMGFFDD